MQPKLVCRNGKTNGTERNGKPQGVIQRSYNAYAVRVRDTNPSPPAGGMLMGGLSHGSDKGAGTLKVFPANQTTDGVLCIEMRIRLYHDGAMSKLLEKLAKVPRGGGGVVV